MQQELKLSSQMKHEALLSELSKEIAQSDVNRQRFKRHMEQGKRLSRLCTYICYFYSIYTVDRFNYPYG